MRTLTALACAAFATAALAADPAVPERRPVEGYGKPEGIIPYTVIGPKLSILTVPAPGFGVEAKFLNRFGLSIDFNLIPDITISGVKAGYTDFSGAARWFPFEGRFFLGAALGSREFHAKATATEGNVTQEAKVKVRSTYIAPEIGWRFVGSSGFFYGIDLGYQIILSKKTTLTIPAEVSTSSDAKDVRDAGDDIGKIGLPIISLMQLGWYF